MEIVNKLPPNYQKIQQILHPTQYTVFTYGNQLYNPSGAYISADLLVHEQTHSRQQQGVIEQWWESYLEDPIFRVSQEVVAYQNQYQSYCLKYKDRNQRAKFLHKIAADLASPLYGSIISYNEAVEKIKT